MHFLEIVNRGYTGELISKDDWDMEHVVIPMMEIVEEFGLSRDGGDVLLRDHEQAKAYFEAGVEFLVRSGVYNQSTSRVSPVMTPLAYISQ